MASNETSVRVSVRIRPLLGKENIERCSECVKPLSSTELLMMGKEKQFTFDSVFGKASPQHQIYADNVEPLVKSLFDGYNATVLAYGQTGSGKTYTMGTSTDGLVDDDDSKLGIIPRAMGNIFDLIAERKEENPGAEFYLRVQFLEVYGEDIRDLLDPAGSAEGKSVTIREGDKGEGVLVIGAMEESVKSTQEMLSALERGALCRTTGSTEMNVHSSRSHAIFTIIIEQHLPIVDQVDADELPRGTDKPDEQQSGEPTDDSDNIEYRTAKFHFVDLAGSERAKRTGATGTRLKEGININKGLLALGNVISALGDETKPKGTHVPYRDSKLTRMLQDSLGGNSRTLMICCVSPADANFEETLNALRYANRARNIKNKPIINRDPNSSQIATLKAQIAQLKLQLYGGSNGASRPSTFGSPSIPFPLGGSGGDAMLREEIELSNQRAQDAEFQVQRLTEALEREKRQRSDLQEKFIMASAQVDYYSKIVPADKVDQTELQKTVNSTGTYLSRIEELERQLQVSDHELSQARRDLGLMQSDISFGDSLDEVEKEIVRNSRLRKSLGMAVTYDEDENVEDIDDVDIDDDEQPPAVVPKLDEDDGGLMEISEEDDEKSRQIKEHFQKTQDNYRNMVRSYDVTLKSKQMIMKKIVEERKRFEAMKAHYETKMAQMNLEVRDTQAQRDTLDEKIKDLELKKKSDVNSAQITKLRLQLKDKNERLKALEKQAKELANAKKMTSKWEQKEKRIQRDIDIMKKQKVEFQRRMEENAKKYREESQKRKVEIMRLRKERQRLAQDKQKLQARNTRDERLLRQKTEQVTSMQRKLRQAQRLTAHNKSLTDKEKKQRQKLESWTRERIKRDEELERLQRSVTKTQAAIERKEKLCRELEECKKAAEQRAKVAEESAARALMDKKQAEKANQKSSIRSLFVQSDSGQTPAPTELGRKDLMQSMTPDELEAMEELEQRLEAAESEIVFHKQQSEAAAANIANEDSGEDEDDEANNKQDDGDKMPIPIKVSSLDEAKSVIQELLQMYVDAKRSKTQLKQTIERIKQSKETETRCRRDMHRRKSLLPSFASGSSPSPVAYKNGIRHHLTSPSSAALSPASLTMSNLDEKLGESSEVVSALAQENLCLKEILKENGINMDANVEQHLSEAKLQALEDQIRQLQATNTAGPSSSRRSSLSGLSMKTPTASDTDSFPTGEGPMTATSLRSYTLQQEQAPIEYEHIVPRQTAGVFARLSNKTNFTGIHKRKLKTTGDRENVVDQIILKPPGGAEIEVDSLNCIEVSPESMVDGLTLNPGALAEIEKQGSSSPRRVDSPSRGSRRVSTESTGSCSSPSFSRMTASYSKRRVPNKRDSAGSTSSNLSSAAANGPTSSKPAYCSAAGRTRNIAKNYPAMSESAIAHEIKTESGTYKQQSNGLYRNTSNPPSATKSRARQAAWESQKLSEIDQNQGDIIAEKENDDTAAHTSSITLTAKPIHEKLSDPEFYTGVQKQKVAQQMKIERAARRAAKRDKA
mmetsp:Transcript_23626/g.37696  ORF Transcript_23626/g.37696 Transcript_23626/m.37696 type:complete len:1511 (+) Transcript_23626:207-4739(+)